VLESVGDGAAGDTTRHDGILHTFAQSDLEPTRGSGVGRDSIRVPSGGPLA